MAADVEGQGRGGDLGWAGQGLSELRPVVSSVPAKISGATGKAQRPGAPVGGLSLGPLLWGI